MYNINTKNVATPFTKFTPEMKKTHTILIPNMAHTQFIFIEAVLVRQGYKVELLKNESQDVAQEGLKYVHNDTCYPALLIIGQMILELKSGKHDLNKVALLITQTGGGCRASNYIYLLRKALVKSGYENIPVASLNFSGLEKDSGFKIGLSTFRAMLLSIYYGDCIEYLKNQKLPYEKIKGSVDILVNKWIKKGKELFLSKDVPSRKDMRIAYKLMAFDFANLKTVNKKCAKIGIVGEIYVKYSPLGNNHLVDFLQKEDCEVNVPGLLGFVQYSIYNIGKTINLYGGFNSTSYFAKIGINYLNNLEMDMIKAINRYPNLHAPTPFKELIGKSKGIISHGVNMGEGWLLTAEMIELIESGFENIISAQPFGCLPNHIVAKGMINKIRKKFPNANIAPIDYDPSATAVNQENRIKLMLSIAKENL